MSYRPCHRYFNASHMRVYFGTTLDLLMGPATDVIGHRSISRRRLPRARVRRLSDAYMATRMPWLPLSLQFLRANPFTRGSFPASCTPLHAREAPVATSSSCRSSSSDHTHTAVDQSQALVVRSSVMACTSMLWDVMR